MKNNPPDRLVAFLDILGFKNLMVQMNSDSSKLYPLFIKLFEYIETRVEREYENILEDIPWRKYYDCEMTMFSDCIVLSAPIESYYHMFLNISYLANLLLKEKILLRGGITIGQIHHSRNTVFGKGLVDAYEIENNADFPRIIIDTPVYEYIKEKDIQRKIGKENGKMIITGNICDTFYVGREDEKYSLNYFLSHYLPISSERKEKHYKVIKESLEALLTEEDKSKDNEKHLEKKKWLAQCFNESLPEEYREQPGLIEIL